MLPGCKYRRHLFFISFCVLHAVKCLQKKPLPIFLLCRGSIFRKPASIIERRCMKRSLYFLALLFLFSISSCSREVSAPELQMAKGEWLWQHSTGRLGSSSIAPINNTLITLQLSHDSTYTFYLNNTVQDTGRYRLQHAGSTRVLYLDHAVQINKLHLQPEQQVLVWDSQRLQLLDNGISNGYYHYFVKAH